MTTEKRKDGELGSLLYICILFGGVLAIVDFCYSAWSSMSPFWQGVGVGLNVLCAILIAIIFIKMSDPNYDWIRKIFCALTMGTIIYVCGFRAALNERNSVIEDSNAAKQEDSIEALGDGPIKYDSSKTDTAFANRIKKQTK